MLRNMTYMESEVARIRSMMSNRMAMAVHSIINKAKAAMMGKSKLVRTKPESTAFSAMMGAEYDKLICDEVTCYKAYPPKDGEITL